ncbi:MAG: tRNA lysidine(34) synthetase TilS [Tuberibacillus sp.]
METQVDQFIKRHKLIPQGSTIVVGVSGGPDSMALLHYLHRKSHTWDLRIIACCIDHQLRGEESRKDLEFVASFCEEKSIAFEGRSVDVPGYQKEHQLGTEEAARICRYNVFAEVMTKYGADLLALAHHGDDQIETMLMRQVRGSFGISKAGMPVKRPIASGQLVRPFLSITKDDIELYCKAHGIVPRRDPSNDSDMYTRNRFRHIVLPFLKKENPQVHIRFQQDSELMTDDYQLLDELAKEQLPKIIEEKMTNSVVISINSLKRIPVPLQRRMIHLILNYLNNKNRIYTGFQFVHIDSLLRWLDRNAASGTISLPHHIEVERSYDRCIFRSYHQRSANMLQMELDVPGITRWPLGLIRADITHTYSKEYQGYRFFVADYQKVIFPLMVRNRRTGDRFQPAGIEGTKKLKKLFIDRKIPRSLRDDWPIVLDGNGDVIWVPLLGHGNYGLIEPTTSQFLILTFEPTDNFRRICNEGRFAGDTNI